VSTFSPELLQKANKFFHVVSVNKVSQVQSFSNLDEAEQFLAEAANEAANEREMEEKRSKERQVRENDRRSRVRD